MYIRPMTQWVPTQLGTKESILVVYTCMIRPTTEADALMPREGYDVQRRIRTSLHVVSFPTQPSPKFTVQDMRYVVLGVVELNNEMASMSP